MPRKRRANSDGASASGSRKSARLKKETRLSTTEIAMPRKRRANNDGASTSRSKKSARLKVETERQYDEEIMEEDFEDVEEIFDGAAPVRPKKKAFNPTKKVEKEYEDDPDCRFMGDAVADEEARSRWPHRYQVIKEEQSAKSKRSTKIDEAEVLQAQCHYTQAEIDGRIIINLNDDAYVQAEDGKPNYICKVIEMFKAVDGKPYFTSQWYYRPKDTVMKERGDLLDDKRVFLSEMKDDNPLGCLIERLTIAKVPLNVDLEAHRAAIINCDYYYNMKYLLPCSTFIKVPQENKEAGGETSSTISSEVNMNGATCDSKLGSQDFSQVLVHQKLEFVLLDLYSGCGAMSTGLCLGAKNFGLNLVTRWAVDTNEYACASLKLNHPETEVRNEAAENFLSLLKEWEKLCIIFSLINGTVADQYFDPSDEEDDESDEDANGKNPLDDEDDDEVFEVAEILSICYGDPKENKKPGLYFKVRWEGYGPDADTWEPREGLSHCRERIRNFVVNGFRSKILPLPGDVDVICGGPPCQGISGFNRFRNKLNPLKDPKNRQLLVFMNFVEHLKPKFVLMENVVDLLRFSDGFLGRYAVSRLLQMNYQTRMGMMAAGSYGVPQFRNRVFLWGALPTETLPQYPLPTHDVKCRGVIPLEFDDNVVRYNEGHIAELEGRLLLEDAISDLPAIANEDEIDEMPYGQDPKTDFQKFIRMGKDEFLDSASQVLFDHRPLYLNPDDYERACLIPKKKGANFRNLPGVRVGSNKKVEFIPDVERPLCRSGKFLVPDYAMTFVRGTSLKPFGRLWWDEIVPTVVTRAEPHNQQILHPVQNRVLSIRENARLQGFPDYYKLCGPVKERYIQVGNAVAVPVARALGYALGLAFQGTIGDGPTFRLPHRFPLILPPISSEDEA